MCGRPTAGSSSVGPHGRRERFNNVINKRARRRAHPATVRHQRRDHRVARNPVGQDPRQLTRARFIAAQCVQATPQFPAPPAPRF